MALDDQPWRPDPDDRNYYLTDAITDRAIEFVDGAARAAKPFFLYLAYTAPHWPLHARPEDIAKYRGKYRAGWDALRTARYRRQLELGLVDSRWPLSPRDPAVPAWNEVPEAERDLWDLKMAVYAAMIDRMDQGIGRIVDVVEELHLASQQGLGHVEADEAEAPAPGRDDVEATVVETLHLAQHRRGSDGVEGGKSVLLDVAAITNGDDAELAALLVGVGEELLDHGPVARLEDVQRQHESRHQRDVEREERKGRGHHGSVR